MNYWLIYDIATGEVRTMGFGTTVPANVTTPPAGQRSIIRQTPFDGQGSELWVQPDGAVVKRIPAAMALPPMIQSGTALPMPAMPDTAALVDGVEAPMATLLASVAPGTYTVRLRGRYSGEFRMKVVDARGPLLAAVKAKRNELRSGIAPTSFGPVDIDIYGRDNITRLMARFDGLLAPLLTTVDFRLANNTVRSLTAAQFRQMNHEIGVWLNSVQARKQALDAQIKAPGANLAAIDPNAGWPAPGTL